MEKWSEIGQQANGSPTSYLRKSECSKLFNTSLIPN